MKFNHLMLAEQENQKADENVLKVVQQHKVSSYCANIFSCYFVFDYTCFDDGLSVCKLQREKETALNNIKKLNEQLHLKHKLQLDIKHLTGKLEVIKLTPGNENSESGKRIAELTEELHEKIAEMEYTENYNEGLIVQEKKAAVELQEARKLAIDVCYLCLTV